MALPLLIAAMSAPAAAPPAVPPIVVTAPARPFRASPVPDRELATMRGGIRLPNGLDLQLGIDIQTRIDGLLALHTVYASDGSRPGIRVYTDGANPVPIAPATQTIASDSTPGIPLVTIARAPAGTTVLPASAVAPGTVNIVAGDPSTWLSGEGQTPVPVTRGGMSVSIPQGDVALRDRADGVAVELTSPTLEIRQLIGRATGVVIANTADNRAIDTTSAINVDLRGLTPGLLTGTALAQRAALDAIRLR